MSIIQTITRSHLDRLSSEAREAPRLRKNLNIHRSGDEPCNRLLNALEPGTYVQAHCHRSPDKDESVALLRGRLGLVVFDERGTALETVLLAQGEEVVALTIPHGTFHSWVCLEAGSVFFESKGGPYQPLTKDEQAVWAPAEGSPDAPAYLEKLRELF